MKKNDAKKANRLTILGLGNILLGDEGFGVHFVRRFSERYHLPDDVLILDGGTLGYKLLDTVCRCETLIVIDVLKLQDQPGSIYRFKKKDMALYLPPPTSAHEVQFPDVLLQAEMLDECPDVIFLCIIPEKYGDMDLAMTKIMEDRFDVMEGFLLKELAEQGIAPVRKSHA
jgi:hydrogenase maturation protease